MNIKFENEPKKLNNTEETISPEIEQEAIIDVGKIEKKRIEVSPDTDPKKLQEEYSISRTTAWRAIKNGYFVMNYHEKVNDPDEDWSIQNAELIQESAKIGAISAMNRMGLDKKDLRPFDFDDLVSSASVRLIEISGNPNRDVKAWRITVARNAAFSFLKSQLISEDKFRDDRPIVEEAIEYKED